MINTDKLFGGVLIGSWANTALYTLEAIQVWRYFEAFPNDRVWLKLAVGVTFAAGTCSTVINCMTVYYYLVTRWGDIASILVRYFGFTAIPILNGVVALVVQTFFVWRVAGLYQTRATSILVSVGLGSLVATALGATVWSVYVSIATNYASAASNRKKFLLPTTLWLTSIAAADLAISGAMLLGLSKVKRRHTLNGEQIHSMGWVFRQLSIKTIETGTITAGMALLNLFTFVFDQESNTFAGVAFAIGRSYSLAMLLSLLHRQDLKASNSTPRNGSFGNSFTTNKITTVTLPVEGIQIDHVTVTEVDQETDAIELGTRGSRKAGKSFAKHQIRFGDGRANFVSDTIYTDEGEYNKERIRPSCAIE
ncbi:hypothetical protein T439DRAFT_359983 [Meredithblackwellia eburnea MCA 4105]